MKLALLFLSTVAVVFVALVAVHERRRRMVAPWRGDRVSERWLLDHVYAHGKRGGS